MLANQSLDKWLGGTVIRDFASEFSTHVTGIRQETYATKIKPVGIPTGAYGGVLTEFSVGMPSAGVLQQFEICVAEFKQATTQRGGVGSAKGAVGIVPPIVFAPGIVKDGEQPYYFFGGVGASGQEYAIFLNSSPVRRSMHRILVTLKFPRHVFPKYLPINTHQALVN